MSTTAMIILISVVAVSYFLIWCLLKISKMKFPVVNFIEDAKDAKEIISNARIELPDVLGVLKRKKHGNYFDYHFVNPFTKEEMPFPYFSSRPPLSSPLLQSPSPRRQVLSTGPRNKEKIIPAL
jgi:hypothetical protein